MGKLKKPTSQTQEVLFELIKNPKGLTRIELMKRSFVLNAPQQILLLRSKGVDIQTEILERVNKFGREIKYGKYILTNTKKAKEIYNQLT